jgi:rhamnogalacturonyl hydrolase YesR
MVVAMAAFFATGEAVASPPVSMDRASLLEVMSRVADWQLAHPPARSLTDWESSVFYTGLLAFTEIAPDPKYLAALQQIGQKTHWRPGPAAGPQERDAADYGVVSTYAQLFSKTNDPHQIAPSRALLDTLTADPTAVPLLSQDPASARPFAMADSLFFGPPALAAMTTATGDPKYLDFADQWWWKTTDILYDPQAHLFSRDTNYIDLPIREPNGQKVFWSRGNGWVLAALARMLATMAPTYPTRDRYQNQFSTMAATIAALQRPDGYWSASLLDPDSLPNPETSGTALFTYALTWGINNGLLDKTHYQPTITKAWTALTNAIEPDGKLDWVQPGTDRPTPTTQDNTEPYGPGALLLAGTALYHL